MPVLPKIVAVFESDKETHQNHTQGEINGEIN